jgi:hypothetical protein
LTTQPPDLIGWPKPIGLSRKNGPGSTTGRNFGFLDTLKCGSPDGYPSNDHEKETEKNTGTFRRILGVLQNDRIDCEKSVFLSLRFQVPETPALLDRWFPTNRNFQNPKTGDQ